MKSTIVFFVELSTILVLFLNFLKAIRYDVSATVGVARVFCYVVLVPVLRSLLLIWLCIN